MEGLTLSGLNRVVVSSENVRWFEFAVLLIDFSHDTQCNCTITKSINREWLELKILLSKHVPKTTVNIDYDALLNDGLA